VASKRRAYDSVDSEFDDDVPSSNAANKSRFFEVYTPFITREKTLIHSRKKKTLTNSHTPLSWALMDDLIILF
jgi:DnaJ family protein C protein 2